LSVLLPVVVVVMLIIINNHGEVDDVVEGLAAMEVAAA